MKFQKTVDAIQFWEQDHLKISDFIADHNLRNVDMQVVYHEYITNLNHFPVKSPQPDTVSLRVTGAVTDTYLQPSDWLIVLADGEAIRLTDRQFKQEGYVEVCDDTK